MISKQILPGCQIIVRVGTEVHASLNLLNMIEGSTIMFGGNLSIYFPARLYLDHNFDYQIWNHKSMSSNVK